MLVIIPVSAHDSGLIASFCDTVNFFGPYSEHTALIVSRPADRGYAEKVYAHLKPNFSSCDLHSFKRNGSVGWPQGPNHYWYSTLKYLERTACEQPWLWMELDMTPIEENWLNIIDQEYQSSGGEFLGNLQTIPNGTHFVGAGIYPKYFYKNYHSWRKVMKQDLAFDVFCQKEIVPHAKNSEFIEHKFRTSHYKCTNQGLQGLSEAKNLIYPDFFTPIKKETVLVHGCTDGSLSSLILNKPSEIFK